MKSYHLMIRGWHIGLFMIVKHDRIRYEGKITRDFLYIRLHKTSFIWGFHLRNVRTIVRRHF